MLVSDRRRTRKTASALVVVCAALSPIPAAHGAEQATSGRIDLYVVDSAFNLGSLKGSGMASVGNCGWLGEGKEKTGASCEKRLGKEWEELWLEFVPEGNGFVDIDLQGEWYAQKKPDDIRLVWADNVSVDGATLANGSFEEQSPDGSPVGWRFTGPFAADRYSRDGSAAKFGKSCVAVWYGSQARQKFAVERGRTYRVHAWFRVLDPSAIKEPPYVRFEFPFDTYTQELTVTLKTEAAAGKASLRTTPLYNGYDWAVSSRWDDNNPDDVKMRDVLLKHGQKGTFYLNSPWRDWSVTPATVDSPFGRELLKGGCTLGGHSLNHPFLSYCSRNRIFEEVAGVRMVWEAAADALVNSYAFSYCNFVNEQEGQAVQADIARALERGGFYGIANEPHWENLRTDMMLSPIMPSDGADIDGYAQRALADESFKERHPNLTHSMHVWYRTPEAWAKFEGQLDKYGHNPNWWYCNQNEYAAYRYQFRHTVLGEPARKGAVLTVRVQRPVLLDLNDPTPLTFEVDGVPRAELVGVKCSTADCAPSDKQAGPFLFHLRHDRTQALPMKVGLTPPNTENRAALTDRDTDTDFPGLRALLHRQDGQLRLVLDNQGEQPLTRVRVTYRLPLAWKEGIVRRKLKDVPAKARTEDTLSPTPADTDYKLNSANAFFVAQVDFARGDGPGRLHVSCCQRNENPDRSYPQGGFLKLGPIPAGQVDADKLSADLKTGRIATQPWLLNDGTRLEWQLDDSPFQPPFLDVEMTRLGGAWYGNKEPGVYLLQSSLHSEREQPAEFSFLRGNVVKALLNGADVTDDETVQLREGENRLVLYCNEWMGCFLRVLKPGAEQRLTNIRFEPPKIEPSADAYRVGGVPA
jgi:hypothetical protein